MDPLERLRERFLDELVGDMDYDPKRGLLYLAAGAATLSGWVLAPSDEKRTVLRLVCAGGAILLLKGAFLLRKSSEGLALTVRVDEPVVRPIDYSGGPSPAATIARVIQDLGAGGVLLAFVLHCINRTDSMPELPTLEVSLGGLALFVGGWILRRLLGADAHGD